MGERQPDIPDDALLVFSDLDEIPSAQALHMLRSCRLRSDIKRPLVLSHHLMPYNLRVGCKPSATKAMHQQGTVTTMGYLRQQGGALFIKYNTKNHPVVPSSGVHLTYT